MNLLFLEPIHIYVYIFLLLSHMNILDTYKNLKSKTFYPSRLKVLLNQSIMWRQNQQLLHFSGREMGCFAFIEPENLSLSLHWMDVCVKYSKLLTLFDILIIKKHKIRDVLAHSSYIYSPTFHPKSWIFSYPEKSTFHILFHYDLLQDIEYSSVLYSRTLLFIYFIYSNLYLLIPNS